MAIVLIGYFIIIINNNGSVRESPTTCRGGTRHRDLRPGGRLRLQQADQEGSQRGDQDAEQVHHQPDRDCRRRQPAGDRAAPAAAGRGEEHPLRVRALQEGAGQALRHHQERDRRLHPQEREVQAQRQHQRHSRQVRATLHQLRVNQ